MSRFFIENILGPIVHITGENANHIIKSLRMKIGDKIILCDTRGTDFHCLITKIENNEVYAAITEQIENKSEPSVYVRLYQAIPKGDKIDTIIQKSVELGVSEIIPVLTDRCIARPNKKAMEKKLVRYNKIAAEAAKQSGRGILPKVTKMLSFKEAIEQMVQDEFSIVFYELASNRLNGQKISGIKSLSIMIGSEGGFSPAEIKIADASGINLIASLGSRILRCETAPITALSILMFQTNNI